MLLGGWHGLRTFIWPTGMAFAKALFVLLFSSGWDVAMTSSCAIFNDGVHAGLSKSAGASAPFYTLHILSFRTYVPKILNYALI